MGAQGGLVALILARGLHGLRVDTGQPAQRGVAEIDATHGLGDHIAGVVFERERNHERKETAPASGGRARSGRMVVGLLRGMISGLAEVGR